MSRVYGLSPFHLRALTMPELDAYLTDLLTRPKGEPSGGR